jgi:hypothetical protein
MTTKCSLKQSFLLSPQSLCAYLCSPRQRQKGASDFGRKHRPYETNRLQLVRILCPVLCPDTAACFTIAFTYKGLQNLVCCFDPSPGSHL